MRPINPPRYLEFDDGSVLLFNADLEHRAVADAARPRRAVSAGWIQFDGDAYRVRGRSRFLDLPSNPRLRWAQAPLYGGWLRREAWSDCLGITTSEDLAFELIADAAPVDFRSLHTDALRAMVPWPRDARTEDMVRFLGLASEEPTDLAAAYV